MSILKFIRFGLIGALAILASNAVMAATAQPKVGILAASTGVVQLREDASSDFRVIAPGTPIYLYDEIVTGPDTRAQILMRDETTFSVGADTALVIDEFIFDPSDHASGQIKANFKKGVFRFISGRIAKANPINMEVKAGNAVIAVRGTEVIGTITADASTFVLLSGQIDMTSVSDVCQTGGAGCSQSLTRPGFGVELSSVGQFSAPTRFQPEEINRVIGTLQVNKPSEDNDDNDENVEEEPVEDVSQNEESDANADGVEDGIEDGANEPKDIAELEPQEDIGTETSEDEDATSKADLPQTTLTLSQNNGETVINIAGAENSEETVTEIISLDGKSDDIKIDDGKSTEAELVRNLTQDKPEDKDARPQRLSDFDLIVMRALAVIADPDAAKPETVNPETVKMELPQNLAANEDQEKEVINEKQAERESTEEVYEEEVEEAVNDLMKGQEKEDETARPAQSNSSNTEEDSRNTAPTLSLAALSNTDDTAADDTFSAIDASATATDTDVDDTLTFGLNGSTQTSNIAGYTIFQAGSYGRLHLNTSSGAYRYVPDDEATEGLTATANESFQITVSDGTDTVSQTLSAVLRGANDTPVLAVIAGSTYTDTAADDSFANETDSLDGSDRDDGQTLTYGITNGSADTSQNGYTHALNGSYGTLFVNDSNGDFLYVPDDSKLEELKTSVTDTFAMTVSDGTVGQRQTYRVTVNGANDTPSLNAISGLSFVDTNAADSFSNQTGSLTASDRDLNETLTYGIDGGTSSSLSGYTDAYVGSYGTLHVNSSSGAYVYVPDGDAIEDLKTSQTDQFTLTVSDGGLSASQTLTTSISGVNDTPILGQISSAGFTDTSADDSFSNVTGTVSATDADAGETITYNISGGSADTSLSGYTQSSSGSYGTLYINASSGAYTYVINDVAMEGAASTVTDTFTVSASDGSASSTSDFVATIDGANDVPVLASISGITVADTNADDSFSNTSATVSGSDRDTGASLTYSINGGSSDTSVSGFTHSRSGTYGTLYIAASSGSYRFIPNDSAVEALSSTVTEDFTLELSDGTASTTQTLTTTLQGVNDTPTLASFAGITLVDTANDDTFTNTTGTASSSDRDSGDTATFELPDGGSDTSLSGYTHSQTGSFGTLYLNNSSGQYTYVVNDSGVEARKTDASDQFVIRVSDGALTATQTLTASVTGANDTPTIGNLSSFTLTDTATPDSFSAQTGTATGNDVDTGDTVTFGISGGSADNSDPDFTHSITGTYGMLRINSTSGAYQFLPDSDAVDSAIATVTENFTITASDGSASVTTDLVATINGVDDTPILIAPDPITIQDTDAADTFSNVTNTARGTNNDSGQTETYGITGGSADTSVSGYTHSRTGDYGTIYINSGSGGYQYIPAAASIEGLTSTQNESFEITFSDGVTSVRETLATILEGVNDRPVLASLSGITITETTNDDTFSPQSGTASATDADLGANISYSAQNMQTVSGDANFTHRIDGTYGDLFFNDATGAYEYRPLDGQVEALAATATEAFVIEATDSRLTSAPQNLTITVNGVDDKPVINVGSGNVTLTTGSAGQQPVAVSDVEGHTITDISNTVATLPSWLNFSSANNGGVVNYYWEVSSSSPAWLNGSRTVSFKARANGLDSDTETSTFTIQCQTDLCGQFVQSTDATSPVNIVDATNVNELATKDELGIEEDLYTLMDGSQMANLFDESGNDSGSFRVIYTANEAGGASNPGTWQVDQRVSIDYSKRDISINNSYQFNNIEYFGGQSGSFSFNNVIDTTDPNSVYAGKDAMFAQPQIVDTGLTSGGQNVLITATDQMAFLNDGNATNASTIWTTLNPHSSNPSNYNDDTRTLSVEEWRVLEPQ